MKSFRILTILIPLVMTSCLEVKTTTRIGRDGSAVREVQLKGSAASINKTRFNIPRNDLDLWEIHQDSLDKDNDRMTATARFSTIDALNRSFQLNAVEPGVQIQASLFKDEGFFFDRFIYQEKLWSELPGPQVPMGSYLSKAELEALIQSETEGDSTFLDEAESERISEQLNQYLEQIIFEDFVFELREGGRRSGHAQVIDAMVAEQSDSLQERLSTTNYYDENPVWKTILTAYVDPDILEEVESANQEGLSRFYADWTFFNDVLVDDYSFSVELPGVIRQTTAVDVRGNLMSWEPSPIRLFFGGITLEAESSVIKPWPLILSGLLLVITLGVTVVGFIRKPQA